MTKTRAFLVHLALSAAVAAAALAVFIRFWYPLPFFLADGGWQGLRLVVAVDVVLGPLLTLVVYRATKTRRALTFDYACIGAVQVLALALGLWTVHGQRTALVAFSDGRFYTVDAATAESLGPQAHALLGAARRGPVYAAVRMPESEEERQTLRRETLQSGRPLHLRADLLTPLGPAALASIASEDAWDPSEEEATAARKLMSRRTRTGDEAVIVPATCRYRNVALAFDPSSADLLDWVLLPVGPRSRTIRVSTISR
ncbi:MAG: hypothetical protein SCH98_02540 [Deferrisomatales bacterium]|nr:hypothetical protein [Deferrisomatales bacterium]